METTPPSTRKALSPVRFFHPKLAPVKVTVKNTRSAALHTCHPHGKAIGLSFGRGEPLGETVQKRLRLRGHRGRDGARDDRPSASGGQINPNAWAAPRLFPQCVRGHWL